MGNIVGNITLGIIRHVMNGAFAGLVTKGLLDHNTEQQAVGAAMLLITTGFSVYDKMQAEQKRQVALMTPPPK